MAENPTKSDLQHECSELKALRPQGRLRRFIGQSVKNGTAYGTNRTVLELQKRGMYTSFPVEMLATVPLELLGNLLLLGPVSNIAADIAGGHNAGALGRFATLQALGIRYVNRQFVDRAGNPIPIAE